MSGPVRRGSRSAARLGTSSPYARPTAKKSSWSISGLLSYLNPLRLRYQPEEEEEGLPVVLDGKDEESRVNRAAAAESLSSRGHQITDSLKLKNQPSPAPLEFVQPPPPSVSSVTSSISPTNATFGHDASPESPQKGLDYLTRYLGERPKDEPLSSTEAEELISIIKKSTPVEEHETFRFSNSNPSTPLRGNSPLFASTSNGINSINSVPFSFSPSYINSPSTPNSHSNSSANLLKRNPNGSYRWEGGGSAKHNRSRNRYRSPAFGPSPRPSSGRLILRESPEKAAEPVRTDTKRRRVGEEALTSSPSPSGSSVPPVRSPAPAPSPTRAAEALRIPISSTPSRMSSSNTPLVSSDNGNEGSLKAPSGNGLRSSLSGSRLRGLPQKPTTPVKPSPLRQAWGQSSSPSSPAPSSKSSDDGFDRYSPTTTMHKATKAATYMNELIKEVTPVRNLDVSNPYQAASPVKVVAKPKSKPKPKPVRRTRASGKPSVPPESFETHINGNGKADDGEGMEKVGEKVDQEKEKEKEKDPLEKYSAQAIIEATLPKGRKRSRAPNIGKGLPNGLSSARSPSPPQSKSKSKSPFISKPQIEEVVDEEDEDERSRLNKKSKGSASASNFKPFALPPPSTVNGHSNTSKKAGDIPFSVSAPSASPVIEEVDDEIDGQGSIIPSEVIEVGNGGNVGNGTLAVFGNEGKSETSGFGSGPLPTSTSNRSPFYGASGGGQKVGAVPREPSKLRFSYQPESLTPLPSTNAETSGCQPVTGISLAFGGDKSKNSNTATATPPTFSQSPAAPSVFNVFPTAEPSTSPSLSSPIHPPPSSSSSSATTSSPSVPSAAISRTITDPKGYVQSLPVTILPVFTFDDKRPVASGSGLSLGSESSSSKAMAAAKEFPQSKLPQFDFDSAPPMVLTSATTSKGAQSPKTFDWSAAGIKPPESARGASTSEWVCSMCMLKNKDLSAKKCAICDADRPSAVTNAAALTFDWAAAGMKKHGGEASDESGNAEWTCSTCMLKNPASVVLKCKICDTPRPSLVTSTVKSNSTTSFDTSSKAPTVQSFDWHAAGLKTPEATVGVWKCATCGLSNLEKMVKCQVCDAPR